MNWVCGVTVCVCRCTNRKQYCYMNFSFSFLFSLTTPALGNSLIFIWIYCRCIVLLFIFIRVPLPFPLHERNHTNSTHQTCERERVWWNPTSHSTQYRISIVERVSQILLSPNKNSTDYWICRTLMLIKFSFQSSHFYSRDVTIWFLFTFICVCNAYNNTTVY